MLAFYVHLFLNKMKNFSNVTKILRKMLKFKIPSLLKIKNLKVEACLLKVEISINKSS